MSGRLGSWGGGGRHAGERCSPPLAGGRPAAPHPSQGGWRCPLWGGRRLWRQKGRMTYVGSAGVRRGGWVSRRRRIAVAPYGHAVAGVLLGLFALAELAARFELERGSIVRLMVARSFAGAASGGLVLCLLCLATTLPLAFRRPAVAAVAVSVAAVVSLTVLHLLTIAGVGAQL